MKTMKFVLAAILLAGLSAGVQAQTNITATATILAPITITVGDNLNFGFMLPGNAKTLNMNNTVTGATQGGERMGIFQVDGALNAPIIYTLTVPANLESGANNLPVTFTADFRPANTPATPGTAAVLGTPTNINMPAASTFFFVGGTATAGAAQAPGVYTGTITLLVTYN